MSGVNYLVLGNTTGANAIVTIEAFSAPSLASIELYQDEFSADGNNAPVARFSASDSANFFDMMQGTTVRALNRFADAYLEPVYHTLDAFNSNNQPFQHDFFGCKSFSSRAVE